MKVSLNSTSLPVITGFINGVASRHSSCLSRWFCVNFCGYNKVSILLSQRRADSGFEDFLEK